MAKFCPRKKTPWKKMLGQNYFADTKGQCFDFSSSNSLLLDHVLSTGGDDLSENIYKSNPTHRVPLLWLLPTCTISPRTREGSQWKHINKTPIPFYNQVLSSIPTYNKPQIEFHTIKWMKFIQNSVCTYHSNCCG